MSSLAILVGNKRYDKMPQLDCCRDDVLAVSELLKATEKFSELTIIENVDADTLKLKVRTALDKFNDPAELFFYFTGHGHVHDNEFYHCATDFDERRPNDTGLSTTALHTLA
jgi:hypothetical protein